MPEPPEWMISTAIFGFVTPVAFMAFLRFEVGVWWSLLLAPITGLTILTLMGGYSYLGDLFEWFRRKKPARPEKHSPPDGPHQNENITP